MLPLASHSTTTTSMLTWILQAAGLEPGFLVGGVLLRADWSAPGRTLRNFYARRILRLFPAFIVTFGGMWLLGFVHFPFWTFCHLFNLKLFAMSVEGGDALKALADWRQLLRC